MLPSSQSGSSGPLHWGSATECMETLDPQTRQLVHDSVVVGRQITEIARGDAGFGCQLHLRLVAGFASTTESLPQCRQAGSPRRRLSPCCPAATDIRFDLRLLQIDLLSAVDQKASGAELRSLSRNRGEHRFQAIGRSVQKAPRADAGKIDTLQPLYSQHVTGVIEIFAPSPTELLHNQILRPGQPYRPAKARENDTTTAVELMLNERIIKEGEEFNEKGGISTGGSNMSMLIGKPTGWWPAAPSFAPGAGGKAPCEPPPSQAADRLKPPWPWPHHACGAACRW